MEHIRPAYYSAPNNPRLRVQNVIEGWNFHKNFYIGNVIKYILRDKHDTPEGRIEDLNKATTYIAMEIENIKKEYNIQSACTASEKPHFPSNNGASNAAR